MQGLDLQLGLHRVLGKESLYVSMLRKFCSSQAQTCPQLRASLAQGGEHPRLGVGVQASGGVGRAQDLGDRPALALQLEADVAKGVGPGPPDQLVTAAIEADDVDLEAVTQAGLGDAPARLQVVDQPQELLP